MASLAHCGGPGKSQVKRQVALKPATHFPDTDRFCQYQPV